MWGKGGLVVDKKQRNKNKSDRETLVRIEAYRRGGGHGERKRKKENEAVIALADTIARSGDSRDGA